MGDGKSENCRLSKNAGAADWTLSRIGLLRSAIMHPRVSVSKHEYRCS